MSYTGYWADGEMGGCHFPDGVYTSPALLSAWVVWFQGRPWLVERVGGDWARRVRYQGVLDVFEGLERVTEVEALRGLGLPARLVEVPEIECRTFSRSPGTGRGRV
jgi:hypothetical protein